MTAIRFILVGVINTLAGLSVIYAAMYFFDFGIKSANMIGYLVGLIISFTLNKKWTFKNRDRYRSQLDSLSDSHRHCLCGEFANGIIFRFFFTYQSLFGAIHRCISLCANRLSGM